MFNIVGEYRNQEHHLRNYHFMVYYSFYPPAGEGILGRIKNVVIYRRDLKVWVLDCSIYFIDRYLNWLRNERVKIRLNKKSPKEYRSELGLAL